MSKFGIVAALALASVSSMAFEAVASPPRFELNAKAGQTVRSVFELTNAGKRREVYTLKTMDWTFSKDAAVQMQDALVENSCRPWVKIERPSITLNSGQKYRYRFEVTVPEGAPASECRFLVAIDGDAQAVVGGPPVAGRLGIVVYVNVSGGKPNLVMGAMSLQDQNGQKTPSILVNNTGTAHGRLSGFLKLKDATGKVFDISPSTFPILPGESRSIFFQPETDADLWPKISYPVEVTGDLEWDGGKWKVNSTIQK